jgi:CubicO group peptidase (beta-lactamase class C family)
VMLLKEAGALSYEDRLGDFFPDFRPAAHPITLRHLLHHTSGLPDYLNEPLVQDATHITNRQVMALLAHHDPKFPPGEQWEYSNSGYTLLATIVERISGQPFHQFMEAQIFGPLGMTNTRVYDESRPPIPGRARSYRSEGKRHCLVDYHLLTTGDGGIFSTIEDMARWDQAMYTEQLVKTATLEEAFTSGRLNDGSLCGYGFGWQHGQLRNLKTLYHGGGGCGYLTWILRIPARRFTVIALSNGGKAWLGKISERMAEMYLWQHLPPR